MIDTSVKAILFDLGGVLINLDYKKTQAEFEKLGIHDFGTLFSQAQQSNLFDDYETGKISTFHFVNRILDLLPKGCNPNQVVHAWNAMILDFPANRLRLLAEIAAKYPIYLLSNTNDLHMEKVRRELKKSSERKLEDFFSQLFLSQQIGLRKPNEDVFHFVAKKMDYLPHQILFIDDSEQHILSAKKMGFQTVHLTEKLEDHPFFS